MKGGKSCWSYCFWFMGSEKRVSYRKMRSEDGGRKRGWRLNPVGGSDSVPLEGRRDMQLKWKKPVGVP